MSSTVIVFWVLNVFFDTFGQLSFKAAAVAEGDGLARWRAMASRPWLWLGISFYIAEFLMWLAFLSFVPLSEGVLLGSINIVVVMVAGRLFFKESLTPLRVCGILLIALGVAVVGMD